MKLFLALLSPLVFGAVTIDHQKASELLKREPRANEGLSEMWETVGDLERECIEEDCDTQEFHEVYDNLAVSNPLLLKYNKCKQYTEKNVGRNRNQQVTVNGLNQDEYKISLRACYNALKDLCPQ